MKKSVLLCVLLACSYAACANGQSADTLPPSIKAQLAKEDKANNLPPGTMEAQVVTEASEPFRMPQACDAGPAIEGATDGIAYVLGESSDNIQVRLWNTEQSDPEYANVRGRYSEVCEYEVTLVDKHSTGKVDVIFSARSFDKDNLAIVYIPVSDTKVAMLSMPVGPRGYHPKVTKSYMSVDGFDWWRQK